MANALLHQGDPQGALDVARGTLVHAPDSAELHAVIAEAQVALGRRDLAIESLERAVEGDAAATEDLARLGELYVLDGKPGRAAGALRRAADMAPGDPDLGLRLARAAEAGGDVGLALSNYGRAFASSRGTADDLRRAATLLLLPPEDGGPEVADRWLAIRWLERAAELDPQATDVFVRLGELYVETGDAERAAERLTRAVETDPGDLHALYVLAGVHAGRDDEERTRAIVEHALAIVEEERERRRFEALLERFTEEDDEAPDDTAGGDDADS